MKRVLVVCHSQSGQLRRCAEVLTEPFTRLGHQVDWVTPQNIEPYPWPWTFAQFVGAMSDCVLGRPRALEPSTVTPPQQKYDLVVLAYQVWFLAPALPIVGWLDSPAAEVLRDTPVVALCACRNMWQRAFVDLKRRILARGGKLIDHVVREDSGPAWATFWSTPRWVMTGDRVGTGILPKAGVSDADIATLEKPGEKLAAALSDGPLAASVLNGSEAPVRRVFVIPELVARFFFGHWANAIAAYGAKSRLLAWVLPRAFFFTLCASLTLMIPAAVVALFIRLLARDWFKGKVDELTA